MSKVICDVCGTTYPETASQCPICGCAKPGFANPVSDGGDADGGYTYVKGGRFSKSNVRKRSRAGAAGAATRKAPARREPPRSAKPRPQKLKQEMPAMDREELLDDEPLPFHDEIVKKSGKGNEPSSKVLIVVLILLLIAIVAVIIYIIGMLNDDKTPSNDRPSISQSTPKDTDGDEDDDDQGNDDPQPVPCIGLTVPTKAVELTVEQSAQLDVMALPTDTTDKITYESADTKIATVDAAGKVTAVAAGEVNITVRCGEITKTCKIVCKEKGPEVPANANDWRLNREDFTLEKPGETWKLLRGSTDPSLITFTSDNEKVVTFKDGVVTAVGKGRTKVHASYNGREFSCWVSVESW